MNDIYYERKGALSQVITKIIAAIILLLNNNNYYHNNNNYDDTEWTEQTKERNEREDINYYIVKMKRGWA